MARRLREGDGPYGAVLRRIVAQYPVPVSLSPDGAKVLVKTRHEADFEIAVHDRASGALLSGTRSMDTQLSLTWRPDGAALAFVASRSGDRQYRLHLWDLASGAVSRFDAPVTYTAAPPIRWSPRGDAVALFVGGAAAGDLVRVDTRGDATGRVRMLGRSVSDADFRWSPDGERIAFVSPDAPGGITVADAAVHGGPARYLPLAPGSSLQDLAWSPDGTALLVTTRGAADEFFGLALVQVTTGAARSVARGAFDIRRPHWLPDGRRYVYETLRDGLSEIVLSDPAAGAHRTVSDRGVYSQILGVSESGDEVRVHASFPDRPPDLATLSLASGVTTTLSPSTARGTAPVRTAVVAADGVRIPIILWKATAAQTRRQRRLVIIVHGGPHVQELPTWDARTQLLVDAGFSVAAVNYRGSSGYGASFERHEDVHAQAGDVVAGARHLTAAVAAPAAHVILLASSAGTRVAAAAARQAPDAFGALVLLATVELPREYCPQPPGRQVVVAFHGRYDPVLPPARARETIARCFGDAAFRSGRDAWRVFGDEGHFFQRSGSWARVYAAVVALGEDGASGRE